MYISKGNNWCHKITVISLFVCIFLENGAINDVWNNEISLPQWSKNLLYLEDGHFGRDKLLFFALNYCQRHRNQSSGHFFYDNFLDRSKPLDMDELKEQLANGNMSYIDHLQYFSKNVKGSDSYWKSQKAQFAQLDQLSY